MSHLIPATGLGRSYKDRLLSPMEKLRLSQVDGVYTNSSIKQLLATFKFRKGFHTLLSEVCQSDRGRAGGGQGGRKEVRTEGREERREGGKQGEGTEEGEREGKDRTCVTGET